MQVYLQGAMYMNTVGIDVSKGRSTIAVVKPFGETVAKPFEVRHTKSGMNDLVNYLNNLRRRMPRCLGAHRPLLRTNGSLALKLSILVDTFFTRKLFYATA